MHSPKIVLLGPMGVGKTTIAAALVEKLKLDHINFDEIKWDIFKHYGFSEVIYNKLVENSDISHIYEYCKQYEIKMVGDLLNTSTNGVFDIGAGFVVSEQIELIEKIKHALAQHSVFILMPFRDKNKSKKCLEKRIKQRVIKDKLFQNKRNLSQLIKLNNQFIDYFYSTFSDEYFIYTNTMTSKAVTKKLLLKL